MDATGSAVRRALWVLLLLPCLAVADDQPSPDEARWAVRGETTARVEYYDINGDSGLGRYAEDGLQAYQDINLGLSRGSAGGSFWDIDVSGVLSGSDYRTSEPGARLEYLRLHHENASARVPYRLDLGDQRARFSRLSLDQNLRGARLELQPQAGRADYSLVWLSGAYRRHYYGRGSLVPEGNYHGASWLMADPAFGDWSFNAVHYDAPASAAKQRQHLVASFAGNWEFDVLHQQVDAEAEWAWLDGEVHSGASDARSQSLRDRGWHTGIAGVDGLTPLPLDYSLSYEWYGADFAPVGTRVRGDSRALKSTAGLTLSERSRLQGRYHRYLDNAATGNPTRIDEHGMQVAAPFRVGGLDTRHTLDLAHRERVNRAGTIDQLTRSANWRLNLPLAETQDTRLNLYWLDLDDRASGRFARTERRVSVAHRSRFRWGELDVTAAPGVAYRTREGFLEQHSLHPTLSLAVAGPLHELGIALGYRTLERPGQRAPDLDEYHLSMDWRYQVERHQLGIEYEHLLAQPGGGENLELWRAGLFWRYKFSAGAP